MGDVDGVADEAEPARDRRVPADGSSGLVDDDDASDARLWQALRTAQVFLIAVGTKAVVWSRRVDTSMRLMIVDPPILPSWIAAGRGRRAIGTTT